MTVSISAPAKLTLSLRIVGRRADGYHLLDAEMMTIDLCDTIEVDESGDGLEIRYDSGVGRSVEVIGTGPDNLVSGALRLAQRTAAVTIHKRIPAGAGLGGGSADAAAVLRWAGFEDGTAAASLGADVPFCLTGGRARVQGIGEIVTPLRYEHRTFTVSTPPIHCDTRSVYERWDELGGPDGANGNDLEPAALSVEPRLARWRDRLGDESGLSPRLAGSGGSWFVEGDFPGPDRTVVRTVPAE